MEVAPHIESLIFSWYLIRHLGGTVHPWVKEAGTRNIALLGAGASVPAGLSTSADLVDALMRVEGTPALRSMLEFISNRIAKIGRTPNKGGPAVHDSYRSGSLPRPD